MRARRLTLVATVLTLSSLSAAVPASAGPYDGQPKILLHRTSALAKNPCQPGGVADCSAAVTSSDLDTGGYVYVLVARGGMPDLGGAGFAIEYQDNCPGDVLDGKRIDIFSWTSCADVQLATSEPIWPTPGSGISLHWDRELNCQTAPVVVGGYFYMSAYEPDTLHVSRNHPGAPISASLVDCDASTTFLVEADLGSVVYSAGGAASGCNPCNGPCPAPLPGSEDCKPAPPPPPPPPPVDYGPKILLHIGDIVSKNPCAAGQLDQCEKAVTAAGLSTATGPFYYVYLLGAPGNLEELAALLVGLDYETGAASDVANGAGVDIFSWTLCATSEYIRTTPNRWPAPGGSNLIIWDYIRDCQTSALAPAGYFYLGAYSSDRIRLIEDGLINKAQVARCMPEEIDLERADLGYVEFSDKGKAKGCNPCFANCSGAVNVTPTTWSRIKTVLGN